ncbi:MAG: glycosyltransferase [Deltaproteobacteria bacterium]|nr:glycosyltransferase [Deltaproteobacteria bacterium]
MTQNFEAAFKKAKRPDIALITNHGYAGVEIPFGGAPDTGGQNMYVNSLAKALDALGYRVTIFARGGFPYFESDRIRNEPEYLAEHVRYIFIPGGGDKFIHKEDIAIALDEQIEWLDNFVRKEAKDRGCRPWELFEVVNTHYWDAAVMGMRLVERWRNDIVADAVNKLLRGAVPDELLDSFYAERHWRALGEAPACHLGSLLIGNEASPATPIIQRVRMAASKWATVFGRKHGNEIDQLVGAVAYALAEVRDKMAPALHILAASEALGVALLELSQDITEKLEHDLEIVDRHVWTPHSLGALKEDNFRDKPPEVVRPLKFCERRDHERAVCDQTIAFAATSAEIAERLLTHYHVPQDQIFYFPPCVDKQVFRQYAANELEKTYAYLAQVSGVAVEKLKSGRIVFETSRMDHTKRKDLLLEAFAMVAKDRDDVYLFIGGGPEKELFKSLSELRDSKPELKGRAILTGFIPEEHIGPLFSMTDIYASASEMEGFGMSVLQAAASGSAVVCSDLVPFAVQYVPDEAAVVPAGEVFDFAQAIQDLLDDDSNREERARQLAEKTQAFDWEAQAAAFLAYLRRRGFNIEAGRRD